MIEIKSGKKHFKPPQPGYELEGCNIRLLKKKEKGNKVFHPGWCMDVGAETKKLWIEEGSAEEFSMKILKTEKSPILDAKGENIEKITEQKEEKPKTK